MSCASCPAAMKTGSCEEYNVQVPQNKTAAKLSALRKHGLCISALAQTQYFNTKAKIYFKNTTLQNITRIFLKNKLSTSIFKLLSAEGFY